MIVRFATLAALFVVAASCLAASSATPRPTDRTHDEFVAGVAQFPYAADSVRSRKIRVGVQALQYCMTTSQVVEFMGEPDFSYVTGGTKNVPKATVLTYVLAQQAAHERETDQRIIVWIGRPDELLGVSVWGIRGLKGLEASANMKCH